jgi:Type II secretion system (T2SS), protein M subtype b
MKSLQLSRRDQQTLTRGMLVILALVILGRGLPWWNSARLVARSRALEAREELLRATSMIRLAKSISDSLRLQSERVDWLTVRLFAPSTAGAGAAQLASLVATMAEESGVRAGTLRTDADTTYGHGFGRASVRVEISGDIVGIMELLRRLEADSILLTLRELSLVQSDLSADDSQPEVLRGDLRVEALLVTRTQ